MKTKKEELQKTVYQPKCNSDVVFLSFLHPLFKPTEIISILGMYLIRILSGKLDVSPTDVLHKIVIYKSPTVFQFFTNVR